MGNKENPLAKLHDLSNFLESEGTLDENLYQLATMAANILNAENCSIMLLNDDEFEELRLRVCANFGDLPASAYQNAVKPGEGISGHVVATGKSLLIEDITQSSFVQAARQLHDPRKSMISSPILINGKTIGVVNVNGPKHPLPFNLDDLNLLDIVSLFIGRSIQVIQLQSILNSRFAQITLAAGVEKTFGNALFAAAQNPDQMAKIVAKSFYREMAKAGFGSNQIIKAASEIISELTQSLHKHRKRLKNQ
ncbi:MAG: GAF domain-containing protein [Betaproteobacteria bacterium CG2_30_59_46]|nr:MAG: GAF domain-containing protein [Betaproteobacteria bacterium CG2_30_59_46]PIQ12267.1 MAG: GAF domain-containing protein [Hydrogenophilales bacterium CG18_big_fil_WC_8_21_14_2_50_58_12]PIY01528.1 MAG: GAF domain-containing protein [Hydrogenophilales bacterium CG_4_10_14_3_um_filter_58_23]PJB03958.1 MAG: GAF domain-containing protein [Hydrogenophilales bacterium CG_4_9_14_3_um_filter_59_35]